MLSGFILMGIGTARSQKDTLHSLLNAAIYPPAVFFFALAILGLVLMVVRYPNYLCEMMFWTVVFIGGIPVYR